MFPEWTVIVGFWIGATIGSFLNVVIYRMPRNIALGKPAHSFCPTCKAQLGVSDLVPLLSWAFAKGKCRHCGAPVSSRYFWVELITGTIWAAIWWQYLVAAGDPAKALAYALAGATLVAIIFIDLELYIIPDPINIFLMLVGFGYNAWLYVEKSPMATLWGMPSSVAGALVGVGVLWGITFLGRIAFGKDAMGHGDIKMARGIGAVLLPATACISFGLAVVLGALIGGAMVLATTNRAVEAPEDDEPYEPESIGSLLKAGLGYVLCFDFIGQFAPKFYKSWFGEDLHLPFEEIEDFDPGPTGIPFGPYLALGAIIATVFQAQILAAVTSYWSWATGATVR